jgi:N-methylhydantoinase B
VIEEVDPDLADYRIDQEATQKLRTEQRATRADRLDEDPAAVAERFRSGELDTLDLTRHYGVILDWGTAELLPRTTEQYRDMLKRRAAASWSTGTSPSP